MTTAPPRPVGFVQQDVFSSVPLLGNPVAVILDGRQVSTEKMALFTRWTNLSEATFLLPPTDPTKADYKVRIFTPFEELPFAGHPTLGSARTWLDHIWSSKKKNEQGTSTVKTNDVFVSGEEDVITQECGVGLVKIKRDRHTGRLALAAPGFLKFQKGTEEEIEGVCEAFGIRREDVLRAQWIDNGAGWFGLVLASAQAVLSATLKSGGEALLAERGTPCIGLTGPYKSALPLLQKAGILDEASASRLTDEVELDGTLSSTLQQISDDHADGKDGGGKERLADWEVKAIFRSIEDPCTGSLHSAFAAWLLPEDLIEPSYVASQGKSMGRRGRVYVDAEPAVAARAGPSSIEGQGEKKWAEIWIAGDTSEVIKGEARI